MKFEVFKFIEVTSTNDMAIDLIKEKKREFGFVYSETQTRGKGTHGKKWISEKGNLFATIFFNLRNNYPSIDAFNNECLRLIKDVQHFDVLRGDKTTAGNSLEIRVPFFDKEFLNFYMNINPNQKVPRNNYEKYLLRKTYEDKLPHEIIWRRK